MAADQPKPLADFERNTYSQYGEDGVIAECLARLAAVTALDHWCVEFGAWDGKHLSNTCRLIKEEGYSAVMVEGDAARVEELKATHPEDRVIKLNRWVSLTGDGKLENILAETAIPENFDFLSIDIDGCDWYIWDSLKSYRPKLVCVEFNPTIPNCLPYIQPPDFAIKHGNGPKALCDLAQDKGYVLVAATKVNLFFVESSLADAVVGAARPTLDALRDESEFVSYVFSGFNGEVVSTAPVRLLWHNMQLGPKRLQMLPKGLQRYSGDYSRWQQFRYNVVRALMRLRYGKDG